VARLKVGATPRNVGLDVEIAQLRELDLHALRAHWQNLLRRKPPGHLSRHLLFRVLAYRLQADRLGDLDAESRRLLDGAVPETAGKRAIDRTRTTNALNPGTTLSREWDGKVWRVSVSDHGFEWKGKTYPSLTQIAFEITGTRWNGPRFFGLRDKARSQHGA
jgi:hypothetical protein